MPRESFMASPDSNTNQLHVEWGLGQLRLINVADVPPGRTVRSSALFNNPEALDRLIRTLVQARRETFGTPPPTASVVEIVETGDRQTDDGVGGVIMPSDVRVNGVSVFTTGGVKVHEIDLADRTMATVTLTLPVRRITVAAEGDLAG
ncbi:MAG: hypothetical protein JWO67_6727 [Streptosporangiaceae bacterium]|nr:hypothetical protein [Streptosporangiaceae bacterium]